MVGVDCAAGSPRHRPKTFAAPPPSREGITESKTWNFPKDVSRSIFVVAAATSTPSKDRFDPGNRRINQLTPKVPGARSCVAQGQFSRR